MKKYLIIIILILFNFKASADNDINSCDNISKKSKTLGYRSRAAFKLIELNNKYKFLNKHTNLLDIGSFPGGWSQVSSNIISSGKILAIDIKKMDKIKNVYFIKSSFSFIFHYSSTSSS